MDIEKLKALAVLLGIKGDEIDPVLGSGEGGEEDCGEVSNFYYNPKVFRKLHSIDCEGLRKLVVPNLSRLRR